jgi:rRNA processing protein Gar1
MQIHELIDLEIVRLKSSQRFHKKVYTKNLEKIAILAIISKLESNHITVKIRSKV